MKTVWTPFLDRESASIFLRSLRHNPRMTSFAFRSLLKNLLNIPLLIIILIVFNWVIIADPMALDPGAIPVFSFTSPSSAVWHASKGSFLVIIGVFLLFLEILKTFRFGNYSLVDRVLSVAIFLIFLLEFLFWSAACNSTCVILMVVCLLDVIGAFVISSPTAKREFSIGGIH